MASTSTQPDSAITPLPVVPSISNRHRCIDLTLVLMVAFAASVLGSIVVSFHPAPVYRSNLRLGLQILEEIIALSLFGILFNRQGRRLQAIGFELRWTDLPKAVGLTVTSFAVMWAATLLASYIYFFVTLKTIHDNSPRSNSFSDSSVWLLFPFLILNGFFEEILVRGYLMTELIDLRKSVIVATVISLGLQTSYHLYYGVYGAAIVGCGLSVFAIYYAKTRRLMPVILAHVLWDFTAVLNKLHHS